MYYYYFQSFLVKVGSWLEVLKLRTSLLPSQSAPVYRYADVPIYLVYIIMGY